MKGRPKKDETKTHVVSVRLSDEDYKKLQHLAFVTDNSMSTILVRGLKFYSALRKDTDE